MPMGPGILKYGIASALMSHSREFHRVSMGAVERFGHLSHLEARPNNSFLHHICEIQIAKYLFDLQNDVRVVA